MTWATGTKDVRGSVRPEWNCECPFSKLGYVTVDASESDSEEAGDNICGWETIEGVELVLVVTGEDVLLGVNYRVKDARLGRWLLARCRRGALVRRER
jgi:hypothetical protein